MKPALKSAGNKVNRGRERFGVVKNEGDAAEAELGGGPASYIPAHASPAAAASFRI